MRLIDADKLRGDIDKEQLTPQNKIHMWKIIDNAPTVANSYDLGYEDGRKVTARTIQTSFNNGYEMAKAEYQRPQGEWIERAVERDLLHNTGIDYICSNCGRSNSYGKPPFCMYCGADMKGGAE